MQQPYLEKIITGQKTIESRFTKVRCPPFGAISPGDKIYFKKAGGPVIAKGLAEKVMFYSDLNGEKIRDITSAFSDGLQVESSFIDCKQASRYCTLIFLCNVVRVKPFRVDKKDRRGWVVMKSQNRRLSEFFDQ
jgi:ASC-1-like (ASCH) protein